MSYQSKHNTYTHIHKTSHIIEIKVEIRTDSSDTLATITILNVEKKNEKIILMR